MLDVVAREETVTADVTDVWGAITDPARIAMWFGDRAEVDLRVGGAVSFGWPAGEISRGVITALEPMRRFAFRWDVFGSVSDPAVFTQVEFRLRLVKGGTSVRVVESGLERLSRSGAAPNLDELYEEHVDGWRNEMTDLVDHLNAAARSEPAEVSDPASTIR